MQHQRRMFLLLPHRMPLPRPHMLRQQAAQQKAVLEQQAMQLTMEYQQKKGEEEMMAKQYDMQKQQYELQVKQQEEMAKLYQQQAPPAPIAAPAYAAPASTRNSDLGAWVATLLE